MYNLCRPLFSVADFTNANPELHNLHVLKLKNKTPHNLTGEVFKSLRMAAVAGTRALMGLQGAEWGKGQIDQSLAHSFSLLSTPTDKALRLDCSFVMAVSPLYVTPRGKDNITFGKNVQLP